MYGLSFHKCVGDIARGVTPYNRVEKIFTRARWGNLEQFDEIIADYRRSHWADCPGKAEQIARELRLEGKFVIPIGRQRFVSKLKGRHWVDSLDLITVQTDPERQLA